MRKSAIILVSISGALALLSGCTETYQEGAQLRRLETKIGVLEARVRQLEGGEPVATYGASGKVMPSVSISAGPVPGDADESGASVEATEAHPAQVLSMHPDFQAPEPQAVQLALKNAGFYDGEIDGKLGPLTKGAVREFQRAHGLQVDGIIGFDTWAQLQPYSEQGEDTL